MTPPLDYNKVKSPPFWKICATEFSSKDMPTKEKTKEKTKRLLGAQSGYALIISLIKIINWSIIISLIKALKLMMYTPLYCGISGLKQV